MKLWDFARLFAAVACVNFVFPPQKLNANETLQLDKRGFDVAFSYLFSFYRLIYGTNVQIEQAWKD